MPTVADLRVKFSADTAGALGGIRAVDSAIGRMASGAKSALGGLDFGQMFNVAGGNIIAAGIRNITSSLAFLGREALGAIKSSADLNAAISNIGAVSNASAADLGRIKNLVNELGIDPHLKVNATEAASAIQMLAKNGLKLPDIIGGAARSTVLLANSTGADFAVAADVMSSAMAQFGISAQDVGQAVNGITAVTTNSKLDINDYRLAIAQAGGVAASSGVEFSDFNTTIAAIAPLFGSGSDAGTSFKTFLQRLIPQSQDASDAMQKLGLITADGTNQFFTANGELRNQAEIVGLLNRSFKGLSEEQKISAMSTIFGTDAMRAASAMANMTEEQYRNLQNTMARTDAEKSAAIRMDNLAGDMEIFSGTVDAMTAQIGERFQPMLRSMFQELSPIVADLAPKLSNIAGFLAQGIASVMPSLKSFNDAFIMPALNDFIDKMQHAESWSNVVFKITGDDLAAKLAQLGSLTSGKVTVDAEAKIVAVDWSGVDLSFDTKARVAKLKLGDVIEGSYNLAEHLVSVNIKNLISGTLDLNAGYFTKINIGDIFTVTRLPDLHLEEVTIGKAKFTTQFSPEIPGKIIFTSFEWDGKTLGQMLSETSKKLGAQLEGMADNLGKSLGAPSWVMQLINWKPEVGTPQFIKNWATSTVIAAPDWLKSWTVSTLISAPEWLSRLSIGAPTWLPLLTIPAPVFNFTWPTLPTWTWPELPAFTWPTLPTWTWPSIPMPSWVSSLLNWRPSLPSWLGGTGTNANGTSYWRGGLTWVDERGAELFRFPDGRWAMGSDKGAHLMDLPKGTQIYSHEDAMRMVGSGLTPVGANATGTTTLGPKPQPDNVWQQASQAMMQPAGVSARPQTFWGQAAYNLFNPQRNKDMTDAITGASDTYRKASDKLSKTMDGVGKKFGEGIKNLESALQSVPGLFGTSQVTQQQMDLANLGVPQNFADDWIRRLTDEVINGVDWAGVDIKDAAARAGLDPSLPAKAILELVKEKWNDSSFFAGGKNLDLINQDAVQAALQRQADAASGKAALMNLFGVTPEEATGQAVALGTSMRSGIEKGLTQPALGGNGDLITSLTTVTPDQLVPVGAGLVDGLSAEISKSEYADRIGAAFTKLFTGFLSRKEALTDVGSQIMARIVESLSNVAGLDMVGKFAGAFRAQLALPDAVDALHDVGARILELVYQGYVDAAKEKDWPKATVQTNTVNPPVATTRQEGRSALAMAGAGGPVVNVYATVASATDVHQLAYQVADIIQKRSRR